MRATETDKVYLAIDTQGGMCDRLMIGDRGLIANANTSIESWKFNAPDDKDIINLKYISDTDKNPVGTALCILSTDNFKVVELVRGETVIIENAVIGYNVRSYYSDDKLEVVDVNAVEFSHEGVYSIF